MQDGKTEDEMLLMESNSITLSSVSFSWMGWGWRGEGGGELCAPSNLHFHSRLGELQAVFPCGSRALHYWKAPHRPSSRFLWPNDFPECGALAHSPPRFHALVLLQEQPCFHTKQRDATVESPFCTMKYWWKIFLHKGATVKMNNRCRTGGKVFSPPPDYLL